MNVPMIAFRDVWKNYGRLDVLKGIDLEVPKGSVTCLIGPSGSGKSTLLRCVNHLEKYFEKGATRQLTARQLASLADAEGTIPSNVQIVGTPEKKGR